MVDIILAKYWTPKGTPLWRHHLPSILIGVLLLAGTVAFGLQRPERVFVGAAVIVVSQFLFAYLARKRFGDHAPRNSSYYNE